MKSADEILLDMIADHINLGADIESDAAFEIDKRQALSTLYAAILEIIGPNIKPNGYVPKYNDGRQSLGGGMVRRTKLTLAEMAVNATKAEQRIKAKKVYGVDG